MSTVFSYSESASAMDRIAQARKRIREIFDDCDKISAELRANLVTDTSSNNVSEAAQNAYNSLKRHFEEFEQLILDNEQNIIKHSENMEAAQKEATSAMETAEQNQNLQ